MIKIEAAKRLAAAYADEKQAKSYLESVADIRIGKSAGRMQGLQAFALDKGTVDAAVTNLTAKFGEPKHDVGGDVEYQWDLSKDRFIQIKQTSGRFYIAVKDDKARFL